MQSDLCLDEIFLAEVWEVNQEKPGIRATNEKEEIKEQPLICGSWPDIHRQRPSETMIK